MQTDSPPLSDKIMGWIMIGFVFILISIFFSLKIIPTLWGPPKLHLIVEFKAIDTLLEGEDVRIKGSVIGYVESRELYKDVVRVGIVINRPLLIREGTVFSIRDNNLLGGKHVELTLGNGPPTAKHIFHGEEPFSLFGELAKLFTPRDKDKSAVGMLRTLKKIHDAQTEGLLSEFLNDKSQLSRDLATIRDSLSAQKNNLLSLFTEDKDFQTSLSGLKEKFTKINTKESAAGKLFGLFSSRKNPENSNLSEIKNNLQFITKSMEEEKGSFPLFNNNAEPWRKLADIKKTFSDIANGKGGLLSYLMQKKTGAVFENINSAASSLGTKLKLDNKEKNGKSTHITGNNPSIMNSFKKFFSVLSGNDEDAMEKSPFIYIISLSKMLGIYKFNH